MKKKKKGWGSWMVMIPSGSRVPPVFLGPDFFPLLGIGSFSPLSACALRWSFGTVSFKRKGGGGVTEVFLG